MRDLRQAAQQALEALDEYDNARAMMTDEAIERTQEIADAATRALRAALAQPDRTGFAHCERACEAEAFKIEIRRLKAEADYDKLSDSYAENLRKSAVRGAQVTIAALAQQDERKPLTDETLHRLYCQAGLDAYYPRDGAVQHDYERRLEAYTRAIERAHGIGGQDE